MAQLVKNLLAVQELLLVIQSGLTLCNPMVCSLPGSSVQDSSDKNTGVGCHFLLQQCRETPVQFLGGENLLEKK